MFRSRTIIKFKILQTVMGHFTFLWLRFPMCTFVKHVEILR